MKIILALGFSLFALSAQAADKPVVVTKLFTGTQTNTGQPIVLPQKNVEVIVSTYDIAPGAALPQHEHPFARYAYVMEGTIEVTNTQVGTSKTYKPGDFIVEAISQWHKGATIGDVPVKLLVIDQVEGDQPNVILKPAP